MQDKQFLSMAMEKLVEFGQAVSRAALARGGTSNFRHETRPADLQTFDSVVGDSKMHVEVRMEH